MILYAGGVSELKDGRIIVTDHWKHQFLMFE